MFSCVYNNYSLSFKNAACAVIYYEVVYGFNHECIRSYENNGK